MSAEIDITVVTDAIRAIPVPVTAVDVTPITGPCKLYGWSLREASGELPTQGSGSVTSPAATTTIATTPSVPAGSYLVSWEVELAGTLAAADANNFRLVDANGNVLVSINAAVAGVYPQEQVEINTTLAGAVFIQNIGAGTAGAVYSAQLTVQPTFTPAAIVEIQDGNQPLAESAIAAQSFDTETMSGDGVHVGQGIKVHVIQGTVTGVLYVRFNKQS